MAFIARLALSQRNGTNGGRVKLAELWAGLVRLAADKTVRAELAILLFAMVLAPKLAIADASIESAASSYSDRNLNAVNFSLAGAGETKTLIQGAGHTTGARLSYGLKRISFKQVGSLLAEQLAGKTQIDEHSGSLSLDQGLAVGSRVGFLGGATTSPLSNVHYFGLRGSQWFLSETLQISAEVRRTQVKQPPLEYTDTDGKRVAPPPELEGLNAGLTITHFTTPSTILRGSLSRTERSDRPPAWALSGEIRQFIDESRSALHLGITRYENVGSIEPITTYGSVVAQSARVEWHQRLRHRFILMGGYRYYLETNTPRAADADAEHLGSDNLYASLRWRLGRTVWTQDAPELYLFGSRYSSNLPNSGVLLGGGGRWLF